MQPAHAELVFGPSGRYRIVRKLGQGGCGIVYEAFDVERGANVALKTLSRFDPTMLYAFKREFRSVADVTHPHLVQLYELVSEGDEWFFTMELVEGADILAYVWREMPTDGTQETLASERRVRSGSAPPDPDHVTRDVQVDHARVRDAFLQLAEGVTAIHRSGQLHRDLKPSNVLVDHHGRVVIVDFGIATHLGDPAVGDDDGDAIVGTPAYMAPEQCLLEPLTEAADWYAFGAVLYKALTGRAPFVGATMNVLMEKQERLPRRPRERKPSTPEDLDALCMQLLSIDPKVRPTGAEVLARLSRATPGRREDHAETPVSTSGPNATFQTPFVGRESLRRVLEEAYDDVVTGKPAVVLVGGASGMGKSTLVRQFLEELPDRRAVVLSGRCYEREAVPYKAFDVLIDELTRFLLGKSAVDRAALMPRDAASLARLFPVLLRVAAIADAPRRHAMTTDAQELRKQAFGALRELFARIGDRRPLVLFVDDIQWADPDSAALLRMLTAPPDAPCLMLVATFRSENVDSTPTLRALLDPELGIAAREGARRLDVDALPPAEARTLALALLHHGGASDRWTTAQVDGLAARVVEQSGGSPLFVGELVRYVLARPEAGESAKLEWESVIGQRIATLPSAALRLLQIVAVAGRPTAQEILLQAAMLQGAERAAALAQLRSASMARAQGTRADDVVECFHDRIREAVVASLDERQLRACHEALVAAMVRTGTTDPEALYHHSSSAGYGPKAAEFAIRAAEKSSAALAFDRAAEFYRAALSHLPEDDERVPTLRVAMGDALAHAGRGGEAADEYVEAARTARAADAIALRRRAAEELLYSGRIDRGVDAMSAVLAHFGLTFARRRWTAVLMTLVFRAWIAARGIDFVRRDPSEVPLAKLTRLDVFLSASLGLSTVDTVLALPFGARYLLESLRVGAAWQVGRALCLEAQYRAAEGKPGRKRVERYLKTARIVAAEVKRADLEALVVCATGMSSHLLGDWRVAYTELAKGLTIYREEALSAVGREELSLLGSNYTIRWEVNTFRYFSLAALVQLGRFTDARRLLDEYLRDTQERGDLYIQTNLRIGDTNTLWLAEDRADEGRRVVEEAMTKWSKRAFQMQHWWELQALCQADLYQGRAEDALDRIDRAFPHLRRSLLLRVQYLRVRARHLRARARLSVASTLAEGPRRAKLVDEARVDARRIEREGLAWASALAASLHATCAHVTGKVDTAMSGLAEAERGFEAADMAAWRFACAFARGYLAADTGAQSEALEQLASLGVAHPRAFSAMLLPVLVPFERGRGRSGAPAATSNAAALVRREG